MKSFFYISAAFFISSTSSAESWYQKKIGGKLLYDLYVSAGVPNAALERTFEFLDINDDKTFKVKLIDESTTKKITNKNYAIIIDYSKPSSSRRLYFLDLKNGKVEKYYVAHGVNTGEDKAVSFSNQMDSKKSSLGFYITGSTYEGKHGESLYLHGLEKSNDRAFERAIVMHGASYVSMDFLEKYGRMGRSWGCPAVSEAINEKLLPLIKGGAVFYAYHKDLMPMTQASPAIQDVGDNKEDTAKQSDEVVPEELNP
ncbi:murein L,D-transpeptidase catalytic domain family protein [Bdellovibrio bacteriovorus]|uniref:murein L,D-transpeptidase catalytic domain family protein n=1 Tax=Bdellovibrio TaxID=958 RepID=UPI0035A82445